MASRSASAVLVLSFLVVAAFCAAEASATNSKDTSLALKANVKIALNNNCEEKVRLVVALSKLLDCKKGKSEVLSPVVVKLEALNLLNLELFVFGKNGKLLKVKAAVNVDLRLLGKLVKGVTELVFDVVEEVVKGAKYKVIKLVCGTKVLVQFEVDLKLI